MKYCEELPPHFSRWNTDANPYNIYVNVSISTVPSGIQITTVNICIALGTIEIVTYRIKYYKD